MKLTRSYHSLYGITTRRAHSILMRRHTVAILGCLCSIVMHAQRLNISIALVAMVNSTKLHMSPNVTECPAPE
ncbi:hypothetical protein X975_06572, partial [Stegodyphus mimosarum]